MWIARRRLAEDIERWRRQGWLTAEGEAQVRHDLLEKRSGPGLPTVLAILGVVLLGFAAMSFVAANWQEMPRLVRLGIIFGGLIGAYGAAAALFARGEDAFAHAAILLGIAVFGAGIMLIAQMYHIEGHPPDAILVWALGALLAGVALRSNPALAAATLLFGIWSVMEISMGWRLLSGTSIPGWTGVHWPLLLAAAAVAAGFTLNRWWPGVHLTGALLTIWLVLQGHLFRGDAGHLVVTFIGVAAIAAALLPVPNRDANSRRGALVDDWAAAVMGYGLIAAFAGLFTLQFLLRPDTGGLVLLATLTLALLVFVIHQGVARGYRGAVWLGYAAFSAEILALYTKTVGSLMGSSLFFLVAGLIVIGLAALATWLHRAQAHAGEETTP